MRSTPGPDAEALGVGVAAVALVAVTMEATFDVLPDAPLVWLVTPLRLVLLLGLAGLVVAEPRRRLRPTWLSGAVATLAVCAGVVTLATGHGGPQWRSLLTSIAAAFLAGGILRRRPAAWPAIGVLALLAVAAAGGVAVSQTVNGTPTGFCRAALDGSADSCRPGAMIRAVGPFANPNILAAFLVLLLPTAVAGALALRDATSRIVGLSGVALGITALPLTGSRGGTLAAVLGVAATLVLLRPTRFRLVLGAVGVVACVLGAVVTLVLGLGIGLRPEIWRASLQLALDHPFGVGLGRAGALLDDAIPGDKAFQHAHNLWLNWGVEAGPIALLAVVAISAFVGMRLVAAARAGSAAAVALGAGLAAFAVMSIADHPANADRISLTLWVVLGLAASTLPRPSADVPGEAAPKPR